MHVCKVMLYDKVRLKHHLKTFELKIVYSYFSASQQGLHVQHRRRGSHWVRSGVSAAFVP